MKSILKYSPLLLLTSLLPCLSYGQWPTTVRDNLLVTAPDSFGAHCRALPFTDNSTLVVYVHNGEKYQVIDKYGQFEYPEPQLVTPANPSPYVGPPFLIPDDEGGALVAWGAGILNPIEGIVGQRFDSLGNRLWSDSGKIIAPLEFFNLSTDGQGGFLLGLDYYESGGGYEDCWIQRVDGDGNPLWGPEGVLVAGVPGRNERYAVVTHGSQGDAYIVWEDHRPPYTTFGAMYAQRFDSSGQRMWANDLFICQAVWGHKLIPDEEGGFIIQTGGASDYNTHRRIDPNGNIVWVRDHLSWLYWSDMVPGEAGYFYLGFAYENGTYGQRVRYSDGMNMWPTWGSGQPGALMANQPGWQHGSNERFTYRYPYFHGVFDYLVNFGYPYQFYGQVLNTLGNRLLGDNGVLMCQIDSCGYFQNCNVVADGLGSTILVYNKIYYMPYVYAKRLDFDGTLGGPYPPVENFIITYNGNDAILTWNPDTIATTYSVYKSSDPYIFPLQPIAVTADTFYVDEDAILEGEGYYRIIWESP